MDTIRYAYHNLIGIFLLALLGGGLLFPMGVHAADSSWQADYTYEKDETNHYIKLKKYNGEATDLVVPDQATIDGETYRTYLNSEVWRENTSLTSLRFEKNGEGVLAGDSMYALFRDCTNLVSLDLTGLDTSQVTTMTHLFSGCKKLTDLNLTGFQTDSVVSMQYVFYKCAGLTTVDLSSFHTDNVVNMEGMFDGCSGLTSLDVTHFKTGKVTNMKNMFQSCSKLKTLDLSGFDTSKVEQFFCMFNACHGLESLNLSSFHTEAATSMKKMFNSCDKLSRLDLSNFDTKNVTDMNSMFGTCEALTNLDISSFDTSKVTDMNAMFENNRALVKLELGHFNTSNVTDMGGIFRNCEKLDSLDLSGFDMGQVTVVENFFHNCNNMAILSTPLNLTKDIELPDAFYDSKYEFYSSLPKNSTKSITLTKGKVDASAADITVADQKYTGSPLEPEVKVSLKGITISDDNYDVEYSKNTDPGKAVVQITFKGNFTGTVEKNFEIIKDPIVVSFDKGTEKTKVIDDDTMLLSINNPEQYDEIIWSIDDSNQSKEIAEISDGGLLKFKETDKEVVVRLVLRKGSNLIIKKRKYFAAAARVRASISTSSAKLSRNKSKSVSVKASKKGTGSWRPTYSWRSSNSGIASVSGSGASARIKGKKAGTTTISCKVKNGKKTKTCKVRVTVK